MVRASRAFEVSRVNGAPWIYSDGGRAAAGFRGNAGDCVTRAIAIASGIPYEEVYSALSEESVTSPRRGIARAIFHPYILALGFTWTATMAIGSGCTIHVRASELPDGALIVRLSRHLAAVINGTVYDTYDPARDGTRCVYGYYRREVES